MSSQAAPEQETSLGAKIAIGVIVSCSIVATVIVMAVAIPEGKLKTASSVSVPGAIAKE